MMLLPNNFLYIQQFKVMMIQEMNDQNDNLIFFVNEMVIFPYFFENDVSLVPIHTLFFLILFSFYSSIL